MSLRYLWLMTTFVLWGISSGPVLANDAALLETCRLPLIEAKMSCLQQQLEDALKTGGTEQALSLLETFAGRTAMLYGRPIPSCITSASGRLHITAVRWKPWHTVATCFGPDATMACSKRILPACRRWKLTISCLSARQPERLPIFYSSDTIASTASDTASPFNFGLTCSRAWPIAIT